MIDLLLRYEPSTPLRPSGTDLLTVHRLKTKRGEAAFSFYSPHIWNKLPENFRSAPTLSSLTFPDSVQLAPENLQPCFNALRDALINLKLVLAESKIKFLLSSRSRDMDYNDFHISTLTDCSSLVLYANNKIKQKRRNIQ